MVVLAVMGILVSAALPSIGQAFAERRVAVVAREVVGMFQRARYMSSAYGRAHQVSYANDSFLGDPYMFETLRGTAASCTVSRFDNAANIDLEDLDCGNNWRCVDFLYARDHDGNTGDNDEIRVEGHDPSTYCYESGSNNQTYIGLTNVLWSNWDAPDIRAGHGFLVYRTVDGDPVGVPRKVFVPTGAGVPRVLR